MALVCIVGVLPLSAFAAAGLSDAPGSITQKSSDYMKIGGKSVRYQAASSAINNVGLPYVFDEQVDVTNYLPTYRLTPRELARKIVLDVLDTTGITATAGIGPNLYLAKVAMDIWAKHTRPDKNGVRIAELNEMSYRRLLWGHRPLTDFWRVGRGYAKKLEAQGLFTMGDIDSRSIFSSFCSI